MTHNKNIKKIISLQIIPNLGFGGVETGVKDIHNYLNQNSHKSFILCQKIIDQKYFLNDSIFELNCSFKNPLNYFKIKKKINFIIKKYKINIVHISSRAPAFYFSKLFENNKGIKLIISIHSPLKKTNFLKNYYNSFSFKGDLVICNSYYVKDIVQKNYNLNKKIIVIERGVDTNYFKNDSNLNKIDYDNIIIFNPSRITSWKGHVNLLKNFSKISSDLQKKIKFKFISSHKSKYEKELDNYINQNQLKEKIIFKKPTNEIKQEYLESNIIINSSIYPEGFGRTISESLALNIPAIATNFGGCREQLIRFNDNLLFDKNSYSSLEYSINYVMKNYTNLSSHSRKFVLDYYSLDKMIKKTIDVYNN